VLEQQLDSCQPLTAAEAEQARILVADKDGLDIEEMQRLEQLLAS
jgi:hypothetical protein